MKITDLKVNNKITSNLLELGYEDLTEIQEQVIEPMLNNQNVLAQAQTGSGKTAAFLVPIIHKISLNRELKGLVIAPTRDLANQIFDNAIKYAKGVGVRCANFFGGSSMGRQIKFLESGIDLIIGTPGRLLDLHKRGNLKLQDVNFLVLDEADQMLDMGFIDDIRKIVRLIGKIDQTALFSATMPKEIMKFVNELMPEHANVKVDSKINVNDVIKQLVYVVDTKNKPKLLVDILGDSERTKQQAIVFSRTRSEAADIAKYLKNYGFRVEALHSDRSQSSRTRALKDFKDNRVQVLVATNVAARGIDVNDLPLVINYNLPENKETYVHRIGRTGRIGKKGEAISFMTKQDAPMLKEIERLIGMQIEIIDKPEYAFAAADAEVIIRESQIKRGGSKSRSGGSSGRGGSGGYSNNRSSRGGSYRGGSGGSYSGGGERSSYSGRSSGGEGRSSYSGDRDNRSYGNRDRNAGSSEGSSGYQRDSYSGDRKEGSRFQKSDSYGKSYDNNRGSSYSNKPSGGYGKSSGYKGGGYSNSEYSNSGSSGSSRSYDSPKKPYDASKRSYDSPKKPYDASKKSYDSPKKSYDSPKKSTREFGRKPSSDRYSRNSRNDS